MKKLICLAALLCITFAGCSPAATDTDKAATSSASGGAVDAMKGTAKDGPAASDEAGKAGAAAPGEAPNDGAAAPAEAPKDAVDVPKDDVK